MFDENQDEVYLNPSHEVNRETAMSTVPSKQVDRNISYKLYNYRHIELALYCLGAALNQICWISLQPCAGAIKNGYGIGNTEIASIGFIYMGIFIIFNFPANYVLDKGGLKVGVLLGILLTVTGMWMKCLINHNFYFVLAGQVIAAIGQPLISCSPAKLSAFWYGENERVIAVTVATAFQPIGVAIGYVFPSFWVKQDDSLPENSAQARHNIYQSLFWQAVMGSAILLICAVGFREKPPTAPSSTEATETGQVWQNIKKVLKSKNSNILVVIFGIILGIMSTYGTIIGIITDSYGYSAGNTSMFGAIFILGGIVGSGVFGGIVEVYKNYKTALIIISWLTATLPIALLFSLPTMIVWLVTLACFVMGFATISVLPVGIDFGVELTHPVGESISSGLLMSSGSFFGIIFTVGASVLITEKGNSGIIWSQCIMIVAGIVAGILCFFIIEDLKRLNEARQKQKTVNESQISTDK